MSANIDYLSIRKQEMAAVGDSNDV